MTNKRKKGLVITFQDIDGNWRIYQFIGELSNFIITDYWKDLYDFKYPIINTVLPDEEDLTLTYPNIEGNSFIKLKDKEYNPRDFSGLGRVVLRKNIVEGINTLTQAMINKSNTIYVIQYDFTLGEDITIPENCIFKFDGGSISNGTLEGSFYIDAVPATIFKGNIKEATLKTITNSTFNKEIQKLEASGSDIINSCIFNGIIEKATIKGTLINCQFEKLSGNIEIGKEGQSIQQMIVQVDLSPNVAQWVQKDGQITQYQECSPLKINIDDVPRLRANAKKECFIKEIGSKKIFYVQLSSDDNTPRGTILMFYPGTLEEGQTLKDVIPDGYAICDGTTEGVPDLRGRFIRSANSYDDVGEHTNNDLVQGESGKNDSIRIKEDNLPSHTHTFNVENTLAISEYTGNSVVTGTASTGEGEVTIPAISSDSHTHSLTGNINISQNPDTFANNPINIEPNAYALIFIMKL